MILIIDENNSFKHSKFTKLVFRDIGKSVKIKKIELTESHKRILLTNIEKTVQQKRWLTRSNLYPKSSHRSNSTLFGAIFALCIYQAYGEFNAVTEKGTDGKHRKVISMQL